MPTFSVREWLAQKLDCAPEDIVTPSGPRASGEGQRADYVRRGQHVATVTITWSGLAGRRSRVISARWPDGGAIDEVASGVDAEW